MAPKMLLTLLVPAPPLSFQFPPFKPQHRTDSAVEQGDQGHRVFHAGARCPSGNFVIGVEASCTSPQKAI